MDFNYSKPENVDKNDALKIAGAFVREAEKKFKVRKALLFGSFAKGTQHADSDIDIALVIDDLSSAVAVQIDLMKMRRHIDLRIEPHPFITSDFIITNPMVFEIMKNGIVV